MNPEPTWVLATHNQGKAHEFRALQPLARIKLLTLADCGVDQVPLETGNSFAQNALIKAKAAYRATGRPALADDSGLVVPALGGAPGLHSARYAGHGASDAQNLAHLLHNMKNIHDRSAYFVAVLCWYDGGFPQYGEGRWNGKILHEPFGNQGFGYDPVFEPIQKPGQSLGQLSIEFKNQNSHRALALSALFQVLGLE